MAASSTECLPKPVPILTQKRQNKALKQVKKKKIQRNLLAKPHDDYWPALKPEDNNRLQEAFQRLLDDEQNVDNIKLEEKKLMALKRKKWSEYLVFGINDVPRSVVKRSVSSVLIADDVNPKHLVQHVATLCGTSAVPVLIVSSLRQHTKQLLGFSSIAVGIKKTLGESKDNKLYEIHNLINSISKKYEPPLSIRQFMGAALERKETETGNAVSAKKTPALVEKLPSPSDDLYLYRTSREGRVFVPESQEVKSETPKVVRKQKLEDFVSLGDSDWEMEMDTPVQGISYSMINQQKKPKRESTNTPPYEPLKYVKVKPNPNKKSH